MAEGLDIRSAEVALSCVYCGGQFIHIRRRASGRFPRFCSIECKRARTRQQSAESAARRADGLYRNRRPASRKPKPKLEPQFPIVCGYCGRLALRKTADAKFCSTKCLNAHHRDLRRVGPFEPKQCAACGTTFIPKQSVNVYCSRECQLRVWYPTKRAKRRTATAVGRVDPIAVFERDHWRCHMCNRKTPRSKRGSFDPDAPELDHIVPLSVGGAHTYENTACSCRACNMAKGAKPLGQLLLL